MSESLPLGSCFTVCLQVCRVSHFLARYNHASQTKSVKWPEKKKASQQTSGFNSNNIARKFGLAQFVQGATSIPFAHIVPKRASITDLIAR